MKDHTKTIIIFLVLSIFLLHGCSPSKAKEEKFTGKVYFTSNLFEGRTFKENTGTCVYGNGKIKRLYRYWLMPRVNKDGTKLIAFTSYADRNVKLADLRSDEIKKLNLKHIPSEFRWFSDGRRLAYTGYDLIAPMKATAMNVYVINLETMEEKQLTRYRNGKDKIYRIELSPDEKYIVYSYKNESSKLGEMRILNIETGESELLPVDSFSFAWNPLTNKIILDGHYNYQGVTEYGWRLMIYDPKTKEITKFPKNSEIGYMNITDFVNSPDGKKVLYVRNEKNGRLTLWTMDPDGSNNKLVADPKIGMRYISWSE